MHLCYMLCLLRCFTRQFRPKKGEGCEGVLTNTSFPRRSGRSWRKKIQQYTGSAPGAMTPSVRTHGAGPPGSVQVWTPHLVKDIEPGCQCHRAIEKLFFFVASLWEGPRRSAVS